MSTWSDPDVAMAVRDLVGQIVHEHLATLRPVPRYGKVSAVSPVTGRVSVILSGETDPVEYPWSDGSYPAVGERVRVNGPSTDRYGEIATPFGSYGVGDIKFTIATTPDPGCVFMTGQTIVDAQTLHRRLWAKAPTTWRSGSNLILPDARGRAFVCRHDSDADWDVIGEVRGAKTHILVTSEMPNHAHGGVTHPANQNHEHDQSANTGGTGFLRRVAWNGSNWDAVFTNNGLNSIEFHTYAQTQGFDANHDHNINAEGGGGAHNNIQPSIVFQAMLNIGIPGLDSLAPGEFVPPTVVSIAGSIASSTALDNAYASAVLPNGYVAVAAWSDNAVTVVNVNNPAAPTIADSVIDAVLGSAIHLAAEGDYVYVACQGADRLAIVNVADPNNISITGSLTHTNFDFANGVAVQGDYAYLAAGANRLNVINITNPVTPTLAGSVLDATNLNGAYGVVVDGNYAYVTAQNGNRLTVVNISNPAAPAVAGSVTHGTLLDTPNRLAKYGNYVLVGTASHLTIVDVSVPATPTIIGSYDASGQVTDVAIWHGYALAASSSDKVMLIDISNPAAPTLIDDVSDGTILDSPFGISVDEDSNYAYVTARFADRLVVVQIA